MYHWFQGTIPSESEANSWYLKWDGRRPGVTAREWYDVMGETWFHIICLEMREWISNKDMIALAMVNWIWWILFVRITLILYCIISRKVTKMWPISAWCWCSYDMIWWLGISLVKWKWFDFGQDVLRWYHKIWLINFGDAARNSQKIARVDDWLG